MDDTIPAPSAPLFALPLAELGRGWLFQDTSELHFCGHEVVWNCSPLEVIPAWQEDAIYGQVGGFNLDCALAPLVVCWSPLARIRKTFKGIS